jgi:hypothetical protein
VRSKKKAYMELVIPRKSKKALSKRSRSAQDKAGVTLAVLKQLCGEPNEELMKEVIVLLAQKLSCAAIQWEDFFLTVDECIVIREVTGDLSTNALYRVLDAMSVLLGVKNLFPTQLRQKIGKREQGALKVVYVKSFCIQSFAFCHQSNVVTFSMLQI